MSRPRRDRCRGTSFVLVPTDNVAEKHRILAMAKPLINNEKNPNKSATAELYFQVNK